MPMRTSTGMWAKWNPSGVKRSWESFSRAPIATFNRLLLGFLEKVAEETSMSNDLQVFIVTARSVME